MQGITTMGFDIAKSVFQVHGIDAEGKCDHPPATEASLRPAILPESAGVHCRYRGLRHRPCRQRLADPKAFRSGRDFSAWVGLVPKQNSSGGKQKLGSISKQGDRYLRSLF